MKLVKINHLLKLVGLQYINLAHIQNQSNSRSAYSKMYCHAFFIVFLAPDVPVEQVAIDNFSLGPTDPLVRKELFLMSQF